MRSILLFGLLASLSACSPADTPAEPPSPATPAPADPEPDAADALSANGWGPIRIGMTRAEVVAAAGEDANPEAVGGPEPEACDVFRPAEAPEGMLVMLENGVVTRITISDPAEVQTPAGFGVGDDGAAVEASYADLAEVTPHKYVELPARYVTVWNTPLRPGREAEARGLRYEIGADGRVSHVHAGGPSIQYVESCS